MTGTLAGVCLAILLAVIPRHAHAERWLPAPNYKADDPEGMDYDKDSIRRLANSPDLYLMRIKHKHRDQVDGRRSIGAVVNVEVDCYRQTVKHHDGWTLFADGSTKPFPPPAESGVPGFSTYKYIFDSTVCKESNKFYGVTPVNPPKWYEFWKRF